MVLLLRCKRTIYCSPFLLGLSWGFHTVSYNQQHEQSLVLLSSRRNSEVVVLGQQRDDDRFVPIFDSRHRSGSASSRGRRTSSSRGIIVLQAGGFAWEDPGEIDSGVENPFKNIDLIGTAAESSSSEGLKIDPARLLGPRLNGSNIYLIGMMGTGKSTIGSILAKRMGTYTFLDTDDIIVKAAGGRSIPELFATEGETGFRNVESQVLDAVHPYVRCVISTGGGIVCKTSNWSKLHAGIVVWLNVSPSVIIERIRDTDRPLLQNDDPLGTLERLMAERLDKYQQADVQVAIDAAMDEDEVANTIIRQLHDFLDDNPPAWQLAKIKAQTEGLDWVK
jgi:shikimate kinase